MRPRNTSYCEKQPSHPPQWPYFLQSQSTLSRSSLSLQAAQRLRQAAFITKSNLINSSIIPATGASSPQSRKALRRLQRQREALGRIATVNAGIAAIAAGIAGAAISRPLPEIEIIWEPTTVLVYLLGFLCLLQVPVTVSYWRTWLLHEDSVRLALWPSAVPRLESSPKSQFLCAFECAVHLVFLYPNCDTAIHSSFLRSGLRMYDLLFLAILIRTYHGVRAWYWRSAASTLRSRFYQDSVNTKSWTAYYLKSVIRDSGLITVLLVCVTGLCVLVEFALEVEEKASLGGGVAALEAVVYSMVGATADYQRSAVGRVLVVLYRLFGVCCLGAAVGYLRVALRLNPPQLRLSQELIMPRRSEGAVRASWINSTIHRCLPSAASAAAVIQRWWRRVKSTSSTRQRSIAQLSVSKSCDCIKSRLESIRTAFSEASNCALKAPSLSHIVPLTQANGLLRGQYKLLKKCQVMVFSNPQRQKQPSKWRRERLSTIIEEASDRGSSHY